MNLEKGSPHQKSVVLSDEEADSWPLKFTFLTVMLNISAKGPDEWLSEL